MANISGRRMRSETIGTRACLDSGRQYPACHGDCRKDKPLSK